MNANKTVRRLALAALLFALAAAPATAQTDPDPPSRDAALAALLLALTAAGSANEQAELEEAIQRSMMLAFAGAVGQELEAMQDRVRKLEGRVQRLESQPAQTRDRPAGLGQVQAALAKLDRVQTNLVKTVGELQAEFAARRAPDPAAQATLAAFDRELSALSETVSELQDKLALSANPPSPASPARPPAPPKPQAPAPEPTPVVLNFFKQDQFSREIVTLRNTTQRCIRNWSGVLTYTATRSGATITTQTLRAGEFRPGEAVAVKKGDFRERAPLSYSDFYHAGSSRTGPSATAYDVALTSQSGDATDC